MFNPWGLVIVALGLVLLWEAWMGNPKHLWDAVIGVEPAKARDPAAGMPGYFPIPPDTPILAG